MIDPVTISLGGLILAAFGAVGGVIWRVIARIDASKAEALVAAQAASAQAKLVHEQLSEFRERVAATYATKTGVSEATDRLMEAVRDVGSRVENRLDGMSQRLDRVIEGQGTAAAVAARAGRHSS